jgi:L-cysteine S-thiosulfotransferase
MQKRASIITGVLATLLASSAFAAETGKDISFNRSKGNCLACHGMPTVPDAEQPGNGGPPLIAMQARFPDKAVLRAKIWDATVSNPETYMPPMGKHQVLTEEEIDKVLEFVYGL